MSGLNLQKRKAGLNMHRQRLEQNKTVNDKSYSFNTGKLIRNSFIIILATEAVGLPILGFTAQNLFILLIISLGMIMGLLVLGTHHKNRVSKRLSQKQNNSGKYNSYINSYSGVNTRGAADGFSEKIKTGRQASRQKYQAGSTLYKLRTLERKNLNFKLHNLNSESGNEADLKFKKELNKENEALKHASSDIISFNNGLDDKEIKKRYNPYRSPFEPINKLESAVKETEPPISDIFHNADTADYADNSHIGLNNDESDMPSDDELCLIADDESCLIADVEPDYDVQDEEFSNNLISEDTPYFPPEEPQQPLAVREKSSDSKVVKLVFRNREKDLNKEGLKHIENGEPKILKSPNRGSLGSKLNIEPVISRIKEASKENNLEPFKNNQTVRANNPENPENLEISETLEFSEALDIPDDSDNTANTHETFVTLDIELLKKNKMTSDSSTADADGDEISKKLVDTLASFGVGVKALSYSRGPSVTRYELQPNAGVKVSKIVNLSDDIALNLAAAGVRIEAPIPGKAAVGIEVPNEETTPVFLREVIESEEFMNHPSKLAFAVGRDVAGRMIVGNIAKMPHLLIAGATGSGKSVCINTIIASILYKASPYEVKLLMIDPKVVELGIYNGIPHLLIPVVTDPKKAAGALNWAVLEMTNRYKLFAENNVRDLKGYNSLMSKNNEERLPEIVIIIDELADLMMVAPNEVEDAICRLAQMARAAGMHLVIATQRPSVDVITGVIKANIPSRISFAVSSQIDSRTILDMAGAEKLIGKGDMLYYPSGEAKPVRVQGGYVSDGEIEGIVNFLKTNYNSDYDNDILSCCPRQLKWLLKTARLPHPLYKGNLKWATPGQQGF